MAREAVAKRLAYHDYEHKPSRGYELQLSRASYVAHICPLLCNSGSAHQNLVD